MKLFVASLVVLVAAVATVSALDDTATCHEFKKAEDDGDIEVMYTDDPSTIAALQAVDSGYTEIGAVSGPCSECECPLDKFFGLVLEPGCDEDEHSFTDAAGVKTITGISYECEYKIPTQTVCTKTLRFDEDGKKASSSWKTSEEPIVNLKRNLRAGRRLSGIELDEVMTGSCESVLCEEKCPELLTANGIEYTLDNPGDCEEDSERGRCSYTNPLYTNDTDEDNDTPCVDVCVIKNKSIEQKCFNPTKAATCTSTFPVDLASDCYLGPCMITDCEALCPNAGCIEEYGGADGLILEGYECDDTDEDDEGDKEPKPQKDLTGTVCWKRDHNVFEEVILEVVVDEPRNSWRDGQCDDLKHERFFCKKSSMKYDELGFFFYCYFSR